jgi:hypothetical protein
MRDVDAFHRFVPCPGGDGRAGSRGHSGPVQDETVAYVAITRLQAAYADAVTRRAWSELASLFRPDAPIRIDPVTRPVVELTGGTALAEFIAGAVDRFEFFEFVILNSVIDVRPDGTAAGRLYLVEVRQDRSSGEWSNAFGVYDDRYAHHDGRWVFARRSYRSLARRVGTDRADIFPLTT